jgi:hypothetical protein
MEVHAKLAGEPDVAVQLMPSVEVAQPVLSLEIAIQRSP